MKRALLGLVVAALTLLTACGTATPDAGPGSGTSGATVNSGSSPVGTYLVDSQGRALYLWVADTGEASTCSGACAAAWPPLTVSGTPTAGQGVDASKLGTIDRADGSKQVTYAKHPLYLFVQDKGRGELKGQGSTGFGAAWWLVKPDGSAITTPVPTDVDPGGLPGY